MFKEIIIISFLIFPTKLYADCKKPVTAIIKGEAAPCTGYLFSPKKELEVRIKNEEYKLLMEQTKIYLKQIDLYKKQVEIVEEISEKEQKKAELWRGRAEDITKEYIKQQNKREWLDWMYFGLGIVTTIAGGWGLGQVR